ncbi:MAG TPA: peptidylprolyl isomerase [Acidimicrobiia bacterium]|nr:peptidylprolyl isomerase [Acidimicrobiia bacterium]
MKRLPVLVAAVAVLALAGGFAAYLVAGSGAPAFTVNGHSVSQSDVNGELQDLADNVAFAKAIKQSGSQALSSQPGSIAASYTAGWLSLRIVQVLIDDTIAQHHLAVTAADRTEAGALAVNLLGSEAVLRSLPASFRASLQSRFSRIVAVRDDDLTRHAARLRAAALATCPSHRFIAHILVSSQAEALTIAGQLAAGADFATLARQHSIDAGSAVQGGELGCLDNQQFVTGFEQVAQTQPVGQVSAPVQTQFGFHLILVRDQPQPADLQGLALSDVLGLTRGARVTLDPRYGTWDRRNGRVVPPGGSGRGAAPAPSG